jgi:pimeloyl-ACP methyl ester carboxylesterase
MRPTAISRILSLTLLTLPIADARLATVDRSANLSMHAEGWGPVTVVFESGLGDTGEVWRSVQSAISGQCARTVSYDRRGYGRDSGSDGGLRDAAQVVGELRTRLSEAGLSPPYVLVGHSLGGLYIQYFARRYPEDVAGLILVDSMHWDQLDRVKAATPGIFRMTDLATRLQGGIVRREFAGIPSTAAELKALPVAAKVPAIVLSSTRAAIGETRAFRTLAAQLHVELASAYPESRHQFVVDSGH